MAGTCQDSSLRSVLPCIPWLNPEQLFVDMDLFLFLCRGAHTLVGVVAFVLQWTCRGQREPRGVSPFHCVGSKNGTKVLRLSAKHLYPLSYVASPRADFWAFLKVFFFPHNLIIGPDFEVQIVIKDKEGT